MIDQAARLAAVGGRHPARRRRRRSSRSATRSVACRSSTSSPTRSAPSPASTSTATSWTEEPSCASSSSPARPRCRSPPRRLLERRPPDRVGARAHRARPDPAEDADRVRRLGARSRHAARSRRRHAADRARRRSAAARSYAVPSPDRHLLFVITRGEEAIHAGRDRPAAAVLGRRHRSTPRPRRSRTRSARRSIASPSRPTTASPSRTSRRPAPTPPASSATRTSSR